MWERGLKVDTSVRSQKKREKKEKNNLKKPREIDNYPRNDMHICKHNYRKNIQPKREVNEFQIKQDDFPDINDIKPINEEKEEEPKANVYAEMCKKTSEEDERRKREKFQPGCIGFKYDKITCKTTYTRDGIHYYPIQKYHEECRIEEEKRSLERWIQSLNDMEQRYEAESQLHFEMYGELDGYAMAKLEHARYDEYAKQFDIDENEEENISDYDEEYYDSDLSSVN